jgi:hypothetical protein
LLNENLGCDFLWPFGLTMNHNFMSAILALLAILTIQCCALSQLAPSADQDLFPPLDQWKTAVLSGDSAGLKYLYSTNPAIQVETEKGSSDASAETNFWIGLRARKIDLEIIHKSSPQLGVQVVVFQAQMETAAPKNETLYVTEAQAWQQQGDSWRLVLAKRSDASHLKQPANTKKDIYPDNVDAHKEIQEAEERAARDHKRVLLIFGANWCYDCHVLDLAFHRPDFASAMAGYEVVHVDIGPEGKKNNDLAKQFQVPLEKGVPALAVIESNGSLVVSQKNGEFENARAMTPEGLLEFLNKWKPQA